MNALLRLLVAGHFAASVRTRARIACTRAVMGLVVAILAVAGAGFLVAAGYQVLSWRYSGPVAATAIGGGFLVLALIVGLAGRMIIRRQARREAPPAPAVDPLSAGIGAVLPTIPPAILVAAVAGFLYGLRGKGR